MTFTKATHTQSKFSRKTLLSGVLAIGLLASFSGMLGQAEAARPVSDPEEVKLILVQEAHNNQVVPPALALAVAKVESDFRAGVASSAGARGVMQIMPATGRGEFGVSADELWDARTNVRIGIAFLERLYKVYGDWKLALSHYNGGSLKRQNGRFVAHSYTRKYVADVMHWWNHFERTTVVTAMAVATKAEPETIATRSGNPNSNWRTRKDTYKTGYWVLEDPAHGNNWKDYLATADLWLERISNEPQKSKDYLPVTGTSAEDKPRFTLDSPSAYRPLVPRFK